MKHAWTSESEMLSYVMRRMEGLGHGVVNRRTFLDRGWCERDGKTWRILDSATRPDRVYPEIVAALAIGVAR